MRNLLSQHANKTAFVFSFFIHAVLFVCFIDFGFKYSEIKADEPLAILMYNPPQINTAKETLQEVEEIKEEVKEEIEEIKEPEITPIAPKKIKKIKKHKKIKKEPKKEIKKEIKEEIKEVQKPQEPSPTNSEIEHKSAKNEAASKAQGGAKENELIAHIQKVLSKEANKNYPMSARKKRQQGIVMMSFTYDNGDIKNIKITKASKYEALNEAAMKSIKNARFKRFNNKLNLNVPLKFQLR